MQALVNIHNRLAGTGRPRRTRGPAPTGALYLCRDAAWLFLGVCPDQGWAPASLLGHLSSRRLAPMRRSFPKRWRPSAITWAICPSSTGPWSLQAPLAEFILPLLIVIGLFTRLASLGMIGFVIVQSLTDLFGHGGIEHAETLGAWFDRIPDSLILDQRLFWVVILLIPVLKGAGSLSVDRLLKLK